MERLHIDLETYSDLPIGGSNGVGAFRYVDDPSFEILLFGYKVDDAPTVCIDLTAGEVIPEVIKAAIYDPDVVKVAFNAAFERHCLHKYFGKYPPPEQWEDTMILAANCGLPLKLEMCCEALHMPEDKAKLRIGATLIREFCCPVKPKKKWNMATRITPDMDPENWELFKAYNIRDVDTEADIDQRLRKWRPSEIEHRFWCLDARINEKGFMVDRIMVRNAMEMDAKYKAELAEKAIAVSGIENPNSTAQIKDWLLEQEGLEVPSLNKKVVADVVAALKTDRAKEFMAIRKELAKASTKKYASYLRCTSDEKPYARGCFQFFGAHTGRFCLTGDHEVLTPEGWVRLDQWQGGQIVTWSPTVNLYSFQKCAPVSFDFDGELIGIEHQRCSQLSTPEHKMPVYNRNGILETKTMSELYGKRVQFPIASNRDLRYPRSGVELRILIMTQADGNYTDNGDLRFGFKKLRKVERCKKLLRQAGIPFRYTTDGEIHRFSVQRYEQPMWLRSFQSKTFGWWMLNEDPAVILDELEYWDAYRCGPNSIQYTTTNANNASVLQAVCHLGGYVTTLLTKQRERNGWNTAYVLNIWLTPGRTTEVRPKHMYKVPYQGRVYCATTPTGYFMVRRNGKVWITGNSGRLIQLQNLPGNSMPDLDDARNLVLDDDYEGLKVLYPSVTGTLSELLRTPLIAEPGHQFIVCDFSAIEARVSAWFAGEEAVLEEFRGEGLIYEATASLMFHVPKQDIKKGGPREDLRKKGKIATLACGYGGGVNSLLAFGADKMGMTNEEMVNTVDLWRAANPRIVRIWSTLDRAMARCIASHGTTYDALAKICFRWDSGIVWMRLPSGREMAYFEPKYEPSKRKGGKMTISYMGQDQKTKKWSRIETWGGRIFENLVQATARDCLRDTMLRLDDRGWDIRGHVHDEVICQERIDGRTVADMQAIFAEPIDWAPGLPLSGSGYATPYYIKD